MASWNCWAIIIARVIDYMLDMQLFESFESDVLSCSVVEAFISLIGSDVLDKIHSRWKLVLQLLLVSRKGTNKVIEEHCSLKKKAMLKNLQSIPGCKDAKVYASSSDNGEIDTNNVADEGFDGSGKDDIMIGKADELDKAFNRT